MKFYSLAAALLISGPAAAAPLGVDFTTATPDAIGCTARQVPGRYSCATMPDQSWAFGDYSMLYNKARGVCSISGSGPIIATGPDGAELRAALDAIRDQISAEYGAPELLDMSRSKKPLPEDKAWLAQIGDMDRMYSYSWTLDPPQNGVVSIFLRASSDGESDGAATLQVNAPDAMRCMAPQ